ncbi:MAG: hypothetical protein V1770_05245 [bacterium]
MYDISNYQKIKEDALKFYGIIGQIKCPALKNESVYFNSIGFNHLVYKKANCERSKQDQITKFKLLAKAKLIIGIATTFQEYDESLKEVIKKKYKKKIKETSTVYYWGFVAIINGYRIKVIIRQIGNGQKYFYSVIPAWAIVSYRDIKLISNCKGNLEED